MASQTQQNYARRGDDNRNPTRNETTFGESATYDLEVVPPSALEAQERAMIDIQIATAKRWPRSLEGKNGVMAKMREYACLDIETAASCRYVLKRKNKDGSTKFIDGPSIRMAEIAVSCYGNIRAATRIVDNDGRKITAQGICHDLERNVAISMETQRRITDQYNRTFSEDMQIITANAALAIALRNSVFKVIPMAIIKPIFSEVTKYVNGKDPAAIRWSKAVDTFRSAWGIEPWQLLKWLELPNATKVQADHVTLLEGLYTAIRDGDTTLEIEFPEDEHSTEPKGAEKKSEGEGEKKPEGSTSAPQAGNDAPPPHDADAPPQQHSSSSPPAAETTPPKVETETALPSEEPRKGPFTQNDFDKVEYGKLYSRWRDGVLDGNIRLKKGLQANQAGFTHYLGEWAETKDALHLHINEAAGKKD